MWKWTGWFVAVAMLACTGFEARAAVSVQQSGSVARYQFQIEGVDLINQPNDTQTVHLQGLEGYLTTAQKVGEPEIPVIRFYVDAKGDIEVAGEFDKADDFGFVSQRIYGIIKPVQPSRIKTPGLKQAYVINSEVYNKSACYGDDKLIKTERSGSVEGWDRHIITVYPMCYNPVSKEISWREHISLRVKGSLRQNNAATQTVNEAIAFVVGKKFKESEALKKYITFKESLGYIVRRIEFDETTVKSASDVRSELQKLYKSPDIKLKYALIIGDAEDVPGKKSQHISGVTDHYYRAIDTNSYSDDINGPDIGVGRLSAASESDLLAIVNKYIRYEIGTFDTQTWLKQVAFLGTNDSSHWQIAEATHNWVIGKHMKPQGFIGHFPVKDQLGGDTLFYMTHKARNTDVMTSLKDGRAIVNYSGHGATTFWDAPRMSQADVRALDNTSSIPFVVSNACITSRFTISESFGETWQRHPNGAVVFWGSMDSTYWDEDDILERRMYDGIFDKGHRTFKDITQHALTQHWLHYGGQGLSKYYWETYVMLGDPSMSLRLNKSQKIHMRGPTEVSVDREQVAFMVTNGDGQPVSGVRVAMQAEDRDLNISTQSDQNGVARFDLRDIHRGPGSFIVSAALHNAGLFRSKLRVYK